MIECRVVMAGFPASVYATLDRSPERAEVEREVLADNLRSIEEGREIAEHELMVRGLRAGPWEPVGPCVLVARVEGGRA